MKISKDIIERIQRETTLEDVVPGLSRTGASFYMKCPNCGKEGKNKGLNISARKQIGKCFSCDFSVSSAIDYLLKVDKMSYPDAVKFLADKKGISLETDQEREARLAATAPKQTERPAQKSFCALQLESSGLTPADVTATIQTDAATSVERAVFRAGSLDQYGRITDTGDDMLIEYYDLEGKAVTYIPPRSTTARPLIRVRWSNPGLHKSKEGREIKYQSPAGSGSHIFIPQFIRSAYQTSAAISRLYIQEGEKKAEKCCKHGIPSIGIMGIQNIGQGGRLPAEIQMIIQRCDVKEVVFLLDADWNDLSHNIKEGDPADIRPKTFFYAVKNYKDYMRTLINVGIDVEIYFGHVKDNQRNDKGVDDLMNDTLKGNEAALANDIEKAIHEKDGAGEYIQLHKITMLTDKQIADMWLLNDSYAFGKLHKDELQSVRQFKIGKILWRYNERGEVENAAPVQAYEQFWSISTDKNGTPMYNFNYARCFKFLQNRGYYRCRMKSGGFDFIQEEGKILRKVDQYDMRDFVTEFTKTLPNATEREGILNMLYRGGPQYLGLDKLSNLEFYPPIFEKAGKTSQCLFFKNMYWEITAEGIKEYPINNLARNIWAEKIIDQKVSLIPDMITVSANGDDTADKIFGMEVTADAFRCDFFNFLSNASNTTWRKKPEEITESDNNNEIRHLLNKLTAIGYLLHDYKNDSELKAVIAMDGKLSEVGTSNGRTGKSLMGVALEHVIPQVYISAKAKKLSEDQFIFQEVTEKTRNVFIDDVRAHFDFEFFFPLITAKMKINPKGETPFTLSVADSPKLFITTNHAIDGEGSSFTDRQAFVVFSDFYNDAHKPIDDFGHNFFSEWGEDQWNLFYNLMACCLQLYFMTIKNGWSGPGQGIIPAPLGTIQQRQLRQMMGEDFLSWAEQYYAEATKDTEAFSCNLGVRLPRQDIYNSFVEMYPGFVRYGNATQFKKKLKFYCKYKGYYFNPGKPSESGVDLSTWRQQNPDKAFIGQDDKTAGKEYITVTQRNILL